MLFIQPEFQSLLAVIVERQKVKVIVCSAVKNPAVAINLSGAFDQWRLTRYYTALP